MMIKKWLSIALSIIMLFCSSSTAFAQEIGDGQQASSTVTYHVDSQYTVYIPEVIDGNNQYTFTAGLMNIAPDESVHITVTGLDNDYVNFTGTLNGGLLQAQMYRTDTGDIITDGGQVASFLSGSTESTFSIEFRTNTDSILDAGDYAATVTFNVSLHNIN